MNSHIWRTQAVTALLISGTGTPEPAAELKGLAGGAFRQVVVALAPAFERQTGNTGGGSSGIADQVGPKAKLKKGGHVVDLIASGEAELGLHQISEIVSVKGAALVGPLPNAIQNTTTYAAGLSASTQNMVAAQALMQVFSGAEAAAVLKSKGMEPAN